MKEGPGGEAGAFKETSQSRDQGALDAPILSHGRNQARRGSRKRPDPPVHATGRGLSPDRLPAGAGGSTGQRSGFAPIRGIQFRYTLVAEPNERPMRPVLSSAGERVTNSLKGCPAWRHPERVSKMIFTDADAI